ncbi:MAG: hypothetical protein ACP6IY_05595 [Promethearchaeia archaeon]
MNYNYIRKRVLILFLLAFPTMLLFGFLKISNVSADSYIPERPHPKNNWHWAVNKNDTLMFESAFTIDYGTNVSNNKILEIYNITGFVNKTITYRGTPRLFSCLQTQHLFYNVTSKKIEPEPFDIVSNHSFFNFDPTAPANIREALIFRGHIVPLVVPLNSSKIEVDILAPIFNNTYWDLYNDGSINKFDQFGYNLAKNEIWLKNSTNNYYLNVTYFDNGTLKSLKSYALVEAGINVLAPMWLSINRTFDYNITEHIKWSFNVGDIFYYGKNVEQLQEKYREYEIKITKIVTINFYKRGVYYSHQYYQCVYANISVWNWTLQKYVLKLTDVLIGAANDLIKLETQMFQNKMDELRRSLGPKIESNLNVTSVCDAYNMTIGPLPNNNNQTWNWAIIEMLDGKDGSPTGIYFRIENVWPDMAGNSFDAGNLTIEVSSAYLEPGQDLISLSIQRGDYFNIYIDSNDDRFDGFFVLPANSTKQDLKFIFNNKTAINFGFSEVIFGVEQGEFFLINTSQNHELCIKVNLKTGLIIYYRESLNFKLITCIFRKNSTVFSSSVYYYNLWAQRKDKTKMFLNMTHIGFNDYTLYYSFLDFNPVFGDFQYEITTMPMYLDIYTNDSSNVVNMNITVHYDADVLNASGIPETALLPYRFNNFTEKWEPAPPFVYNINPDKDELYIYTIPEYANIYAIGTEQIWKFGVNESDIIIYEDEGYIINETSGRRYDVVDVHIYNITAIYNETIWYFEEGQYMELLNMSQIFYNTTTKKLELDPFYPPNTIFYGFGDNRSSSIRYKFLLGMYTGGIPLIVPLRFGKLDLVTIANALNKTAFSPMMAPATGFPTWNVMTVDIFSNSIYFANTTSGYYMHLWYNNNGTLKNASVYSTYYINSTLMIYKYNLSMRIDFNTTKTIEWNVTIGEEYYYGNADGEYKIVIVEISIVSINLLIIDFKPYSSWLIFENVWADLFIWNATIEKWEILEQHIVIGAACDLLHIPPGKYLEYFNNQSESKVLIFPKGINAYNISAELQKYMNSFIQFDQIINVTKFELTLYNSTNGDFERYIIDSTGMVILIYEKYYSRNYTFMLFRKEIVEVNTSISYKMTTLFYFSGSIEVSLTIFASLSNITVQYSILSINPTKKDVPSGVPAVFIDLTLCNYSNINNFILKVVLPSSIAVKDYDFLFWFWDFIHDNKTFEWNQLLLGDHINSIAIDENENSITITFNKKPDSLSGIFAITFVAAPPAEEKEEGGDGTEEEETSELEIPGYNLFYIFLTLIAVAVILSKKKRKLLRKL